MLGWVVLLWLLPFMRLSLLDQPNARSSHTLSVPRGGGIVFVLISSITAGLELFFAPSMLASIPLIALPLSLIGFLDDRYNLPATWRYVAQLLTAFALLVFSPLFPLGLNPSTLIIVEGVLLLIAITAVINFINFMDGLDGLVAGCMSVVLVFAAIELGSTLSIWSLFGGLIGFLALNWKSAKVFMGDVGSTFLGAVFAGLVLQSSNWTVALSLLFVATPLLADACFCVPRRLWAGQRVFQSHRLHLYQRLHQAGWSHARVSSLYLTLTVFLGLTLLWGGLLGVMTMSICVVSIGAWLDQRVALPFSVALRRI